MKYECVSRSIGHDGQRRLLLFFAGWAMEANPFRALSVPGMDVTVAWDYRYADSLPDEATAGYDEICVMAWSFGVPAAADFMLAHKHLPFTGRIAVNGTLTPVSDTTGIPERIFHGTLTGLDERSLRKFYRRMFRSAEAFGRFAAMMPARDVEELKEELEAVAKRCSQVPDGQSMWDTVLISEDDAIIPAANQRRAWAGHNDVRMMEGGHCPDMAELIRSLFVNKSLVAHRFGESRTSYGLYASVQEHMAAHLGAMWPDCGIPEGRIIEIGAGSGMLTREYQQRVKSENVELWDIADIDSSLPGRHVICDGESAICSVAAGSVSAILSSATLQWFNSPMLFVRRAYDKLMPGGIMLLSTFGPENYKEITAGMTPLRYVPVQAWRELASELPGMDITVEEEVLVETFDTPRSMLRHIRLTGVNALPYEAGQATVMARRLIAADVRTLTYHPVYIRIIKRQS
ncbi:MAG: DUF452 family protein [Muribaculaceae bacterium]|nr:DUF452 family protein [Muribaculaceae bacterium]